MARRIRNYGVVYAGKVGAKMRPPRQRTRANTTPRHRVLLCQGGPYDGRAIAVSEEAPGSTLPFVVGGWPPGCYGPTGQWTPV